MFDTITIQSHKGPYLVSFIDDFAQEIGKRISENRHYIIDRNVAKLYGDALSEVLKSPSVLLIDATEDNKTLEKMPNYVSHLVEHGLRRDHTLVAIGGGITQDITCFLSATMLRGVPWEFWPTTLLAQADSCIGSKSSINTAGAKNILGTFTPPQSIFLDVAFLKTLDETDVRSGVGEMLKVHVIDGLDSFGLISTHYHDLFSDPNEMLRFIKRSMKIKKPYIERDEFDVGARNIFNYGHSFGHAIEAATSFGVPHGIAITIGMDMANYISAKLGVGKEEHFQTIHPVCRKNFDGYENVDVPLEPFIAALLKDKKNVGGNSVTLILLDNDGVLGKGPYPADDSFSTLCDEYLNKVRNS